ncbi:MAG TPA: type II toxin-antitoxin system Phd/YefM family antitoxin [Thermoanaerobaculia bacterium]|nr:type II toxin-antitoxin system Phd/YefM family antitoxin [Thermoanaerobaculia bacterium]
MPRSWQIQEAKNKLSEVVEEAIENGPQILTRRGEEVAVVLSLSEYRKLKKKQTSLSEFFRQSPLEDLELERDRSPVRPGPEL